MLSVILWLASLATIHAAPALHNGEQPAAASPLSSGEWGREALPPAAYCTLVLVVDSAGTHHECRRTEGCEPTQCAEFEDTDPETGNKTYWCVCSDDAPCMAYALKEPSGAYVDFWCVPQTCTSACETQRANFPTYTLYYCECA